MASTLYLFFYLLFIYLIIYLYTSLFAYSPICYLIIYYVFMCLFIIICLFLDTLHQTSCKRVGVGITKPISIHLASIWCTMLYRKCKFTSLFSIYNSTTTI